MTSGGALDDASSGFRERFGRMQEELAVMQRNILELTSTAWSADKLVSATVGSRGDLRALYLDPRIFRNTDAAALSAKITAVAWEATREVAAEIADLVRPVLGREGADKLRTELLGAVPGEAADETTSGPSRDAIHVRDAGL